MPLVHKMDGAELAELMGGPKVPIFYLSKRGEPHNTILYKAFPAPVLSTFSDHFRHVKEDGYAEIIAWPRDWVVKTIFDYMLKCCSGDAGSDFKDLTKLPDKKDIKGTDVEGNEFGDYFKMAYLHDFAHEYGMRFIENKLKDEMKYLSERRTIRSSEIYNIYNYYWDKEDEARVMLVKSIAKAYVKDDVHGKKYYEQQRQEWPEFNEELQEMIDHFHEHGIPDDDGRQTGPSAETIEGGGWDTENIAPAANDWKTGAETVAGGGNSWVADDVPAEGGWGDQVNDAEAATKTQW